MSEMIDYMLIDKRRFGSDVEKLYLNKIKELLIPENDSITKIKTGRNQQERLEIINKEIYHNIIEGNYLEAEILYLFHTAEFNNLQYLPD